MEARSEDAPERGRVRHTIQVADETLTFRPVEVDDVTPTGAQIAIAAGFRPAQEASVLEILASGDLEDLRPDETTDLRESQRRFIVVETDRTFRFTLDGQRFDWPRRVVSGFVVRKLGRLSADVVIFLERRGEADRLVRDDELVRLDPPGVEEFRSRKRTWKLEVQGVPLTVDTPTIVVRDALQRAGFDPNKPWHIFLKLHGQPKEEVTLDTVVDLRRPGIERIRLTPKEVNNGEAERTARRMFALLDDDVCHLDARGLRWETVIDGSRRWLVLHDYPLPAGLSAAHVLLAFEIPPTYPGAQIDSFFTCPKVTLASGAPIAAAGLDATIAGVPFNGWSRHRGRGSPWDPARDNVSTHLALVDSALEKEAGA